MRTESRVSVALCTFNGERFVRQQLESILQQSAPPAELIVSDDGSTDGTLGIVRQVAGSPLADGVEVVVLTGGGPRGVTGNFQRAVSAATGDLIALSDQDDVWHEGRLARLAGKFVVADAPLLIHTNAELIDPAGESLGRSLFESLEVRAGEIEAELGGRAFEVFLRRNLATGATVVFRRELLEAALPFGTGWVHDEWLAVVAAAIGRVELVLESTIGYRQHGGNQIGVAAPTIGRKIGRVLEPRGNRNAVLAERFALLTERLEALGDRVPLEFVEAARQKARFEAERATLPPNRLGRLGAVRRIAAGGRYGRFASRGRADIVRDLLQPA